MKPMHAIIVGCGRVGSTLARELSAVGNDVVVIDRKADAFRRLGDKFLGRTMIGVGFDRDVLAEAAITPDSAVMAVTSGDNSNILIARVAREMFGVQRVVARIYDPRRAAIYERLGIATVATVSWTTSRILRLVEPTHNDVEWTDPTSTHVMAERRIDGTLAGTPVSALEGMGVRLVLLTRNGRAQLPPSSLLLQEADTVHLVAAVEALEAFDLGSPTSPGGHR
ncbi:MAG: TrkA family potassium uptake protein [Actinomycetota bacterium]